MPIRHNNRGTIVIERSFGKTKVRRASGTHDLRTFEGVIRTLDALTVAGRTDLVEAVANGLIKPLDLYERARAGSLPVIAGTAADVAPTTTLLAEAVEAFLSTKGAGDLHMKDLRFNLARIVERAEEKIGPRAKLSCLPDVVALLRAEYLTAGHRSSFNTLRVAALCLARGKRKAPSALWEQVVEIERFKIDDDERREHKPLSVLQAVQLRELLNEKKDGAGGMFWVLCTTGMRPKEYFSGAWSLSPRKAPHCIVIHGTKTKASKRKVPLVEGSVPSARMAYSTFSRLFREIVKPFGLRGHPLPWTLYDARRSYAVWCEAAGIPRSRRRYYMGHSKEDITAHYERQRMIDIFLEDSTALRSYLPAAYRTEEARMDEPQTPPLTPLSFKRSTYNTTTT